jgi:ADP-ribose pyrophosphatase YjhB (NUDIX family)
VGEGELRKEPNLDCTVHKLVADIALFAEGQVLLVKYHDTRDYDGQKGWFLPDDYLTHGEHPDEAVARIAREQVGISPQEVRLRFIESFEGGPEKAWHLIFHYAGQVSGTGEIASGANIAEAEWFALEDLPARSEMAHGGWAQDVLQEIQVPG